jgi:hypothetical protein
MNFLLLLIALISFNVKAEAISNNEYQLVVATAYDYFEGAADGDQTRLEKAFDFEFGHVKMITIDKESGKEHIRSLGLKEFARFFKQATKEPWEAKVLSVDIVKSKMAMVKLDFQTPKNHYIDYLVMYKRNEQWKIINKTFVAQPQ